VTPELYCEVHEGSGPYLLLVHGFLSGRSQWIPNLEALAEVSRPVVIEMWGHGRSPSPEDTRCYTPDGYIDAFESIRERLGVPRWWICGMSLGATLTLRYAALRPQRMLGQIFTNTNSGLADAQWTNMRLRSTWEAADLVEREGLEAAEAMEVHPKHARNLPPDLHAALLSDAKLHEHLGIVQTLRYTSPDTTIRERLSENQVSSLLVSGEREKRFPPIREFVEATMPHLTVVQTEAGHSVNIDASQAFDHAVVDFIRAHPVTPPGALR
jgi:pimeloyl-ACP methyl ester carboxylesterase